MTVNDLVVKPMLVEGNVGKEYTPYGKAIELCKIGTYQDKIDKSTGKNLLDLGTSNSDYVSTNGQTSTIVNSVSNNSISMNIAGSGGTYFYRNQKLSGNNTFTISFKAPNRYFRLYVRIRNTDDTDWLTSSNFTPSESGWTYNSYYGGWYYEFITVSSSSIYEETITIPNCSYWLIGFGANTALGEGTIQTISNIQVEKGNTATSYEPYGTDWYVEKKIGKVVLNGSENWSTQTNYYQVALAKRGLATYALTNYFSYGDTNGFTTTAGYFRLWDKTTFPTSSALTTWLGTHNTILYYALENATYTKITDTTLINQLEALKSKNETTNISQVANDLPFELSATALEG